MELQYEKIEKYLLNLLDNEERLAFEKELESNPELKQRFEFYKQLKDSQSDTQINQESFSFSEKILPSIIDSSLSTQESNKRQNQPILISVVLIAMVALSGYMFLYIPMKKNFNSSTLSYTNKLDSLNNIVLSLNTQIAEMQDRDSIVIQDNIENNLITENNRQKETIHQLKKELEEVKNSLYSNSNVAGNSKIKSIKAVQKDQTILTWDSDYKVQISIYDLNNNLILKSNKVKNQFKFDNLSKGYYQLHLIPENSSAIRKIMEIKSKSIEIWNKK